MTHTEKGGKNSNDRVGSPESIPIHLKACCDRVVGLSSLLGHAAYSGMKHVVRIHIICKSFEFVL